MYYKKQIAAVGSETAAITHYKSEGRIERCFLIMFRVNAKEYGRALSVLISGIMNGQFDKKHKTSIPI